VLSLSVPALAAQDAQEALGAKDNPRAKAPSPLTAMMATLPSALKPALAEVHPRVYFTSAELDALRTRLHGPQRAEWEADLTNIRALHVPPPPPPAELRRAQNEVGMGIAEAAFAYEIERDPKYLEAAKTYMDAAVSYDIWGYATNKPNTDLAAGHLLYGLGTGYDLLYNDLTPAERERYRKKLAVQGHLMYEAFKPKPGRSYAYSQNHTFIPIAGLGIAAYAVYGEVPEAAEWARLSRAIYERVLQTYSHDGYYYEGYEYVIFSTPWLIHYLDALQHSAGVDLFDQPGLRSLHLYFAHDLLPGGQQMFDFGDVYDGPVSRADKGEDYERSHPDGHFLTNYNLLYDLAARFHSTEIQGVADWMRATLHQTNAEPWWSLVWRDPKLASTPIAKLTPYHRFEDIDVVFWRSDWSANATAIAFKCGPPEGHTTTELLTKYPDWRLEDGHVHPDVNSFIVFAHGQYLTGDSGYAGVPRTAEHNSLLVDGRGQGKEGTHDAWGAIPYAQLNKVRLANVRMDAHGFDFTGEGAAAYAATLGLTQFTRHLHYAAGKLTIEDEVASTLPHTFTELLHSDTTIQQESAGHYNITAHGPGTAAAATMRIFPSAPPAATMKIEPNVVMGPGPPGAVDKGTPETRGERLAVSTPSATSATKFVWTLTF
jgi:hypothetical protein